MRNRWYEGRFRMHFGHDKISHLSSLTYNVTALPGSILLNKSKSSVLFKNVRVMPRRYCEDLLMIESRNLSYLSDIPKQSYYIKGSQLSDSKGSLGKINMTQTTVFVF
jgi:hypothetical protein